MHETPTLLVFTAHEARTHDPSTSVVNAELAVHDTPGLYVLGSAVCPSSPGINPTLPLWALCVRAADRLVARLRSGEEL